MLFCDFRFRGGHLFQDQLKKSENQMVFAKTIRANLVPQTGRHFHEKKKQLKMITHKKAKNEHVVKKRFVHILIDSRVFSIKLLFLENIDSESFRIK